MIKFRETLPSKSGKSIKSRSTIKFFSLHFLCFLDVCEHFSLPLQNRYQDLINLELKRTIQRTTHKNMSMKLVWWFINPTSICASRTSNRRNSSVVNYIVGNARRIRHALEALHLVIAQQRRRYSWELFWIIYSTLAICWSINNRLSSICIKTISQPSIKHFI